MFNLKKATALFLSLLLISISLFVSAQNNEQINYVNDDFQNETVGTPSSNWLDINKISQIEIKNEDDNKFMRITKIIKDGLKPQENYPKVVRNAINAPLTGNENIIISTKMRTNSNKYRKYLRVNFPENSNVHDNGLGGLVMLSDNGKFFVKHSENYYVDTEETFELNKWNDIKIVLNCSSKMATYYYNGKKIVWGKKDSFPFFDAKFTSNKDIIENLMWTFRNDSTYANEYIDIDNFLVQSVKNSDLTTINDNFENEQIGSVPSMWSYDHNKNSDIKVLCENGNKFVRIAETNTAIVAGEQNKLPLIRRTMLKNIPVKNTNKPIVIETKFRSNSNMYRKYLRINFPYNSNDIAWSGTNAVMESYTATNEVRFLNGMANPQSANFVTHTNIAKDKWYKLKIVLFGDQNKIAYYFGDETGMKRVEFSKSDIFNLSTQLNDMNSIDGLAWTFRLNSNDSGIDYFDFDDFKIYPYEISNEEMFNDSFENTSMWEDKKSNPSFAIKEENTNSFMRITRGFQNATNENLPWVRTVDMQSVPFNVANQNFVIRTKIRTSGFESQKQMRLNTKNRLTSIGDNNVYSIWLINKDGKLLVPFGNWDNGSPKYEIAQNIQLSPDIWYDIAIVINAKENTAQYYVDGVKCSVGLQETFSLPDSLLNLYLLDEIAFTFRDTPKKDEYMDIDNVRVCRLNDVKTINSQFIHETDGEINVIKNGKITRKVMFENNTETPIIGSVILAVYNELQNKMIDLKCENINIGIGEKATKEVTVDIVDFSGLKIKAMLVNTNNMIPIDIFDEL